MTPATIPPLAERIRRQNWDQGCLLDGRRDLFAADLREPLTAQAKRKAAELTEPGIDIVFEIQEDQKMVIVSQRCDLVASLDDEPLCEAVPLVVWPEDRPLPQSNSARRFVLDHAERLVADQSRRFMFEKTLLPDRDAVQLLPDANQWRSFRAWCARRYSRHAFPDDFVETVGAAIAWAISKENDGGARAIHTWRALLDDSSSPVEVSLLVPFDEQHEDAGIADAYVQAVVERAVGRLPSAHMKARERAGSDDAIRQHEIAGVLAAGFGQVTLRDLRDFDPIDFEHLTFAGNEVDGVEPHDEDL